MSWAVACRSERVFCEVREWQFLLQERKKKKSERRKEEKKDDEDEKYAPQREYS
jgi:hypothetical protein